MFDKCSITYNCCDDLGKSDPKHVVELGKLHNSVSLRWQASVGHKCSIGFEVSDKLPDLSGSHWGVSQV